MHVEYSGYPSLKSTPDSQKLAILYLLIDILVLNSFYLNLNEFPISIYYRNTWHLLDILKKKINKSVDPIRDYAVRMLWCFKLFLVFKVRYVLEYYDLWLD